MGELAKTAAGQARIAAASERLDKTVADLGQRHRTDVSQGEMGEMGHDLRETPPSFEPTVEPASDFVRIEPQVDDEVPAPSDYDLNRAERIQADPGMDIDYFTSKLTTSPPWRAPVLTRRAEPKLVSPHKNATRDHSTAKSRVGIDAEDTETDLRELMAVMTRDAKESIREEDAEIIATIRALGGNA